MSPEQVQAILADFANRATHLNTRADGAEIWRFNVEGNTYELHYWVDDNTALKKYLGGAAAAREFAQLQTLQKLGIPATRVIANLKGFRIGDRKGDACVVVHDPSARPAAEILLASELTPSGRLALMAGFIELLERLYRAKLCPVPLVIDRFAVKAGQIILADGSGELGGIVTDERLLELDGSTRFATRVAERVRFWKHFRHTRPRKPSRSEANALLRDAASGEGAFGRIAIEEWSGRYLRKLPMIVPWVNLQGLEIDAQVWTNALPTLLTATDGKFKSDKSGSVFASTINIGGRPLELIVKRPAFKAGLRGALDRFRVSRAARTWNKTWRMLGLGFACEVPLLLLERRGALRLEDQLIVFARVPGSTLAGIDLNVLTPERRRDLLCNCGRVLRRIEQLRFTHADAKNTNWIAWADPRGALRPILIDLDGIRFYPWRGLGIERFVRAMKTHAMIVENDVAAIQRGYSGR